MKKLNDMESLFQFTLLLLSVLLLGWIIIRLKRRKQYANTSPYKLKKRDVVLFNNRHFEVIHHTRGKYNIRSLDSVPDLVQNVERKSLKLVS